MDNQAPEDQPGDFTTGNQEKRHFRIGFANQSERLPFAVEVRKGLERAAQAAGKLGREQDIAIVGQGTERRIREEMARFAHCWLYRILARKVRQKAHPIRPARQARSFGSV